ncbi:hypothetical protein LXN10_01425 [Arcobacter sp. KX21116]|jgi:hypothetical protein|uniref:hypothetical protein n=1 Tax=Arcobacter iocasae TaxID=2906515 RepID=UPI0035D5289B
MQKMIDDKILSINKYLILVVCIPMFLINESDITQHKELVSFINSFAIFFDGIIQFSNRSSTMNLEYFSIFQIMFGFIIGLICFCISIITLYRIFYTSKLGQKDSKYFSIDIYNNGHSLNNRNIFSQLLFILIFLDIFIFSIFFNIYDNEESFIDFILMHTKLGISIVSMCISYIIGVMIPRVIFEIYGKFFMH